MTKSNPLSYQSAGVLPAKLVINQEWNYKNKLRPIHLQIYPTNKCNANCSFCSCAGRDKSQELDWGFLKKEIVTFAVLGGKAITLTGGGEPLMYEKISELIEFISSINIKVGLVTNGRLLGKTQNLDKLTWCRISSNDNFDRDIVNKIDIDWSLSYVWDGNSIKVKSLIGFSNENPNVSHFRIVNDINNPQDIPKFDNDEKVIYQAREGYDTGSKRCWMGIVKPVLNADGLYYPCCGVQYATNTSKQMPPEMVIGKTIKEVFDKQKPFDGSVCKKCYYKNYNDVFDLAKSDVKHLEFI
ncbi:MAG: radical SAM protein [Proteobacteria bacterium]|nr:radical SAM protein [Pseudomonadota bacterium]